MNRVTRGGVGLLAMGAIVTLCATLSAGADVRDGVSSATKSHATPRLTSSACSYLLSMKTPSLIATSSFINGVAADATLKSNMTNVALSYSLNYEGLNTLESVYCSQLGLFLESTSSSSLKVGTTAASTVENFYGVLEDCVAVANAVSLGSPAQNFFPGQAMVQSAISRTWPHLKLILAAKNVSDF